MISRVTVFVILFLSGQVLGQSIDSQRVFGGSEDDIGTSIYCSPSYEIIICGSSESNDADIAFHFGPAGVDDVLILKTDSNCNVNWNNSFGGTSGDKGIKLIPTFDNSYLLQAYTRSTDENVSGIHNHGPDIWLAKLNSQFSIEWENCFGSFDIENPIDVIQLVDSGFIAMGETDGDDGDVSGNHAAGNKDIWVFKLDKLGVLQWQTCLGSWTFDSGGSLVATEDNGILVLGSAITGQGGTIQCNSSILGQNVWLVKLDSLGNVMWDKCYGSSGNDEGVDIIASPNGGYSILGYASYGNGDVTGYIGMVDFWLLKIDESGNLLWQNCYGSPGIDIPYSIALAQNGDVLMCGLTNGTTGQAASNHGSNDVFVVRTDSMGNHLWSQCYGGSGSDIGYSIAVTPDGFPVFTGMTESNDGDVSGNHGGKDLWLVKLNESPVSTDEISNNDIEFRYSYKDGQLTVSYYSNRDEVASIQLYDLLGKEVLLEKVNCTIGPNTFSFVIPDKYGVLIFRLKNSTTTIGNKILLNND